MKKALIVSTVSRQFTLFERGNIEVLKELGYEIYGAANYEDATSALEELEIKQHHIDIQRSPFKLDNFKAYKQLVKLMKEEEFDLVHCHAPMGGVIGRLAAKSVGIKNVLYTAHGFHFFKGAPLINNIIYKNIERWMAQYTNTIITINQEDFKAAKKFKLKMNGKVEYVPGIGVNIDKIKEIQRKKINKKQELGMNSNNFIILSVGEINKNKNHEIVIKALSSVKDRNWTYIICGKGEREEYLKKLVEKLKLTDKVRFLGFREDILEIYRSANLFIFASFREGLSVALMEAMASGLPIICSNIRGNQDLINSDESGFLVDPSDSKEISEKIIYLMNNKKICLNMGNYNEQISQAYGQKVVKEKMKIIYSDIEKIELSNKGIKI